MRLSFSDCLKLSHEVDADFDIRDKEMTRQLPAFPPKGFDLEKWQSEIPKISRCTFGVITALQRLGYKIEKDNKEK